MKKNDDFLKAGRTGSCHGQWVPLGMSLVLALFYTPFILHAQDTLADFEATQRRVQAALSQAMASTVGVGQGGSGVIVSADGLVLTAAHVSGRPNRRITCRMPDGQRVQAETLGRFDYADAGMIQLQGEGPWPHSPLMESMPAAVGDWCFALGHPGGFDENRGAVLRVGKVISVRSDFIRTGCELLRGDSGGPLFNLQGEVIGIHSRIGEPLDDNYHAPLNAFIKMWDELLAGVSLPNVVSGRDRGSLGVGVESHAQGVMVKEVRENSAAAAAGFRVSDIIQAIDGFAIEDRFELRWAIGKMRVGDSVQIKFLRDGKQETHTVELGKSTRWQRRGSS
jgi:serine protease Do